MNNFDKLIQEAFRDTADDSNIDVYGMMYLRNIKFQHLTGRDRKQWFNFLNSYSSTYGVTPKIQTFTDEQFDSFIIEINKIVWRCRDHDEIDIFLKTVEGCKRLYNLNYQNSKWIIKSCEEHSEWYIGCEVDLHRARVQGLRDTVIDDTTDEEGTIMDL